MNPGHMDATEAFAASREHYWQEWHRRELLSAGLRKIRREREDEERREKNTTEARRKRRNQRKRRSKA